MTDAQNARERATDAEIIEPTAKPKRKMGAPRTHTDPTDPRSRAQIIAEGTTQRGGNHATHKLPKPKTKKKPVRASPEVQERILELIEQGHTLRSICLENPDTMPTPSAVIEWTLVDRDFAERYAHARLIGFAALAEDILDIADGKRPTDANTWQPDAKAEGRLKDEIEALTIAERDRRDPDLVQRDKLRIEARKWILSKMLPKIYGERRETDGQGGIKGPMRVDWGDPVDR